MRYKLQRGTLTVDFECAHRSEIVTIYVVVQRVAEEMVGGGQYQFQVLNVTQPDRRKWRAPAVPG